MQRFEGEGPEDEQVERALRKVDVLSRQFVPLLLLHDHCSSFLSKRKGWQAEAHPTLLVSQFGEPFRGRVRRERDVPNQFHGGVA